MKKSECGRMVAKCLFVVLVFGTVSWVGWPRSRQPATNEVSADAGQLVEADATRPTEAAPAQTTGEAATAELQRRGEFESLGAAFEAARRGVEVLDPADPRSRGAGFYASNPAQHLRAWFGHGGVELESGQRLQDSTRGVWNLGLRWNAGGRTDALTSAQTATTTSAGSRVEMTTADGSLTQWFDNGRDGLEHGFTVAHPPAGQGNVEVVLAIEGNLHAELAVDGARFLDAAGRPVVQYGGLVATDATNRQLPSHMELRGTQLALVVADAGAQYPITIDPFFQNIEARLGEAPLEGDQFGTAVALSGDTALIGAPDANTSAGSGVGCAYVFVHSGTAWSQQAKLTAADAMTDDHFGSLVVLEKDTALVGTRIVTRVDGLKSHNPYVFVRKGAVWSQQAELAASDASPDFVFGASVALSGETALVAAPSASPYRGSGAVYAFVRNGTVWTQQGKIVTADPDPDPDPDPDDAFGFSVALSGETAVIARPAILAADVFVRSGSTWTQQATLAPPHSPQSDNLPLSFGLTVAVSGDTALIGATGNSAYVFVRKGTAWRQQAVLLSGDNPFFQNDPGPPVAISGDVAVLGLAEDTFQDVVGFDRGHVCIFQREGSAWRRVARREGIPGPEVQVKPEYDRFGSSVALSGDQVLAGVPFANTEGGAHAGSALVLVRRGAKWVAETTLIADNSAAGDLLGSAVALNGNTAVAGAPDDSPSTGLQAGSAYVFVRAGTNWSLQAKLLPSDGGGELLYPIDGTNITSDDISISIAQYGNRIHGDEFGTSVALSGDTAVIGAHSYLVSSLNQRVGGAYVFVRDGTNWLQQAKLTADVPPEEFLGRSVAVSHDTAIVAASHHAYVFLRNDARWKPQAVLPGGDGTGIPVRGVAVQDDTALFGAKVYVRQAAIWSLQADLHGLHDQTPIDAGAVALSGNTALIGVEVPGSGYLSEGRRGKPQDDVATFELGRNRNGAPEASVFVRTGSTWTLQATLPRVAEGGFGASVALSGDAALIGAPYQRTNGLVDVGAAYLFARTGAAWELRATLDATFDSALDARFGNSVAIDGDRALVGADHSGALLPETGGVYVFQLGEIPEIAVQPQSQSVAQGAAVTFSVVTRGTTLSYQWRKDGQAIEGATSPSYTIPAVVAGDQGEYDVVVANRGGSATSALATLGVNDISVFTQALPGAVPDASGFVLVNLSPAGVATGWRFSGELGWRTSGVPVGGLTTGDRTIQYRPVAGYTQPDDELVSVESGAAATVVNRTYTQVAGAPTGSLRVTLLPQTLADPGVPVAQRAQWRLLGEDDTSWRDSGTQADGLAVGSYLIESKPVAGRTTPSPTGSLVVAGQVATPVITYSLTGAPVGAQPGLVPFATATSSADLPFNYLGQLRSDAGAGTGFVVTTRVVVTAGHVVFDDGTLSAAPNLQWLFQRDAASYEPVPQIPRGSLLLAGYAAARAAEGTPGVSRPPSQNLDAATLYFLEDAGRGGSGGYLASDADANEWLVSPRLKILAGYPVDGIPAAQQGEIFASTPLPLNFAQAFLKTYVTKDVTSVGGMSGAPLSVQYDDGRYYPAGIYLGGAGETVVRALDGDVVDLITQANTTANGGDNNVGGGITQASSSALGDPLAPGSIQVNIAPASAVAAGAKWSLGSSALQPSGSALTGVVPGNYVLQFNAVAGFRSPELNTVSIRGGRQLKITFTYLQREPKLNSPGSQEGVRGQPFNYQISATNDPTGYFVYGTLPSGLTVDNQHGLLSGTPGESGKFTVTVKASNPAGSGTKAVDLIVRPAVPDQVAVAGRGQPLRYQIASGEPSATYAAPQGLPDGLALDPDTGFIRGAPAASGIFTAPISVTVNGAASSADLTFDIGPELAANGDLFLSGAVGQLFSSKLISSPESGVTYSADHLPPGLMVEPATGEIKGTPTVGGIYDEATITGTTVSGSTHENLTIVIDSTLTVLRVNEGKVFEVIDGKKADHPIDEMRLRSPERKITLLAVPAKGFFFTGWTGLPAPVHTAQLVVSITDGLTVTPNFRAFADFKGRFTGLIQSDPASQDQSGLAKFSVTAGGKLTGTLFFGGRAQPLKETFDSTGAVPGIWIMGSTSTMAIQLEGAGAADRLDFKIDDPSASVTSYAAERVAVYSKAHPAPDGLAGRYTALVGVPKSLSDTGLPPGEGPATITVKATGVAILNGQLPDGTPYASAGSMLPDGRLLIYAPFAFGRGSVFGTLSFKPDSQTDAHGDLVWFRDSHSLEIDALLQASHFTPPRAAMGKSPARPLFPSLPTGGTSTLKLSDGGLADSLTRTIAISRHGSLSTQFAGVDPLKVSLVLDPRTGKISGSFVMTDIHSRGLTRAIKGAVLQKANRAGGFILPTRSALEGRLDLTIP